MELRILSFIVSYLIFLVFFAIVMKQKANRIYLLLGSNLNMPQQQLNLAQKKIGKKIGKVIRSSSYYQTAAWGNTLQPDFINQLLIVETKLDSFACMNLILSIEEEMGRVRKHKYEARIIDIDILFYDKEVIHAPNLIIPHPYIQERRFVLTPLNELVPNYKHPVLQKSVHQLLLRCKDKLSVKKYL